MLRYTGHPIVDVGAATIAAFAGKSDVASVTEEDLDQFAAYMEQNYVVNPLKSFLTVAFPNSGFTNPAFEKNPGRRLDYARMVGRAFRADVPGSGEKCVFFGEPALGIPLTESEGAGRAFRQHIPLVTGEGVINFHPGGDAGLPVSGLALLCIQAFPLGCAKCGGRLLAVHADSEEITLEFARAFLEENMKAVQLARQSGSTKLPEAKRLPKTLLVETLLAIEERRRDALREDEPASVTAYHLSNSGQSNPLDVNNPPLAIYHLPLEMTGFLRRAMAADYRGAWQALVQRAWQLNPRPEKKGRRKATAAARETEAEQAFEPRRNVLFEDLFGLPENAPDFVRRYFLRIPRRFAGEDDPRRYYSLKNEADLVSWRLTELFLERVMNVDKRRIQEIRALGDRLADYVDTQNDRRFFLNFFREQNYGNFRAVLLKANLAHVKRGNPPLITLDPYLEVFEDGVNVASSDWRLARDLVLIRLIETLYERGWLGRNQDVIPEIPAEEGD
ncbi:MAG: type I-B CRISPR-associated protein Cas8b1/Cst1 [Armatimonadetes bacterium]|nr:type I-B CRISPR-associated protein Cas8b1/Cst1 [Armatimonadota bacterium]